MLIYFHTNRPENPDAKATVDYLKKFGLELASSKTQQSNLAEVDALIVQGDDLDPQANYFIALAIAENKPVLCLFSKKINDQTIATLENNQNFQSKVTLVYYQPTDLSAHISAFIKDLDAQAGQEVANIKYTLRISQKISDYLAWKIGNAKRKKAFWLRDQLQSIMDQDKEYQKILENKYKVE